EIREIRRRPHSLDQEAGKIAERARKIRAFLHHPEQHVDNMRKLVAEILHLVEPDSKTKPTPVLSERLDASAFMRAMCSPDTQSPSPPPARPRLRSSSFQPGRNFITARQ